MKKSEAAEIVMMLIAAYPATKATEQTAQIYETMLVDLDAGVARAAVQRLLSTSKFLPSIAEIREACTAQTRGPRARGEEAYAALMMACRKHGYDYGPIDARRRSRDPLFGDPLIGKCLTMWGGWNAFALADHDAADRARFIALYDELAGRERQDLVAGKPLPPAAAPAPVRRIEPPRPAPAAAAAPVPLAQAPIAELLATLTPKPPANREQAEPRRWTAEELDAALAAGGRK